MTLLALALNVGGTLQRAPVRGSRLQGLRRGEHVPYVLQAQLAQCSDGGVAAEEVAEHQHRGTRFAVGPGNCSLAVGERSVGSLPGGGPQSLYLGLRREQAGESCLNLLLSRLACLLPSDQCLAGPADALPAPGAIPAHLAPMVVRSKSPALPRSLRPLAQP
jgi:hypothetical protein